MSDFELHEHRGWGVYLQNSRTGDWYLDHATLSEALAEAFAAESQRVEEVTIRPVCLGADPVQWAAVQMAMALLGTIKELRRRHIRGIDDEYSPFWLWRYRSHQTFGGSLEREEEAATARKPGCQCHWEEGDSPCPVHDEDEEDGGGLEREP